MSFSVDENLSNISLDVLGLPNETDENKDAREKKNKQKQARRNRARHREEEMERYQSACREVERKRLEDEAAHQQRLEDKMRNRERGEREGVLASASRNLEADFMKLLGTGYFGGHRVINPGTNRRRGIFLDSKIPVQTLGKIFTHGQFLPCRLEAEGNFSASVTRKYIRSLSICCCHVSYAYRSIDYHYTTLFQQRYIHKIAENII